MSWVQFPEQPCALHPGSVACAPKGAKWSFVPEPQVQSKAHETLACAPWTPPALIGMTRAVACCSTGTKSSLSEGVAPEAHEAQYLFSITILIIIIIIIEKENVIFHHQHHRQYHCHY